MLPKANFPAVMVGLPSTGEYDSDLDGADTVQFPVYLLASGNDDITARHLFDSALSRGTDDSLKDLLEDAEPSGFDSLRVTGWDSLEGVTVNDVPAYGITLNIEIIG